MSEIRQDITTEEWVIMARERAMRPHDFESKRDRLPVPAFLASCPFCPGNETETPGETLSYLNARTGKWQVRSFVNRYPALTPDGSRERRKEGGFFISMDGIGTHEVLVEGPIHNRILAMMDEGEVETVLRAYRERYRALIKQSFVQLVLIFKNHGQSAGTSLEHPHSQLIATPLVPRHIRMRCAVAIRYYDHTCRCLYSDIIASEKSQATRMVMETDKFVVFHPFASRSPFETWILPKRYEASFANVTEEEMEDLSHVLRITLLKLYKGLNNPDYNYIINSVPKGDEYNGYYLWHIRIIPRLVKVAGFEIGSGIHINTALPEETASFIRGVEVE
jgi:UDPglucose--hexose-1-phosphate uridylyltransferase